MNISDEELKQFADIDPEAYMEILSPLLAQANVNMVDEFDGFRKIQEMAQELLAYREAERKIDMLSDSIWIAGAKFGWNCGVAGDNDALQASIEGRIRERVKDKKECT